MQQIPSLAPGRRAACARCGRVLAKRLSGSSDRCLAFTITALIAFIVANAVPLMELRVAGRFASTTIVGGAYEMWQQGQRVISVLVAFCAVLAPASYIVFMLALQLGARRSPIPDWAGEILRWLRHLQVWSMLEVVMLGILVALIKIAQLATVDPGIGMYAFGATVLLIPAVMVNFDARELWGRVEWSNAPR